MATTSRLSREQCEKALAAFIISSQPSSPIAGINVYVRKGQFNDQGQFVLENPDELPLPCIAVSCPRAKPHEIMEYPVCELHVMILNSVDEENASTAASARFGFLAELLSDSKIPAVLLALNRPERGTDLRKVKNFNAFGMYQTDDMGQETDRHWIDHLVFDVHCVPTDDADGDGQS